MPQEPESRGVPEDTGNRIEEPEDGAHSIIIISLQEVETRNPLTLEEEEVSLEYISALLIIHDLQEVLEMSTGNLRYLNSLTNTISSTKVEDFIKF